MAMAEGFLYSRLCPSTAGSSPPPEVAIFLGMAFFSLFPGFTILGEIFAYVTVFNPTIEVVTFRLREWCMLGVFLLPALIRPGHERQDLLGLRDGMHVCTD